MTELPRSLPEFEARFPDDAACARWLLEKRWPDGFRCPACGHDKAWELGRERLTLQCAACERQVSVTAGTVLHGSHLGLRTWFLAAWLMATHENGISARQLWQQLGLGSYKSAWLLARKLRRAMVDPGTGGARRPGRGRRDLAPLSRQGRAGPARTVARGQAAPRRRGRDQGQGAGPDPARGDRRLLGRRARRLRRRRDRRRQHGGERRLVRLRQAQGRQARPEGGRRRAGPPGPTLDPSGVREREAVGLGRVPRAAREAPPGRTSTSSCSGSTAGATPPPPSTVCSASASPSSPPPTRCWSSGAKGISHIDDTRPDRLDPV